MKKMFISMILAGFSCMGSFAESEWTPTYYYTDFSAAETNEKVEEGFEAGSHQYANGHLTIDAAYGGNDVLYYSIRFGCTGYNPNSNPGIDLALEANQKITLRYKLTGFNPGFANVLQIRFLGGTTDVYNPYNKREAEDFSVRNEIVEKTWDLKSFATQFTNQGHHFRIMDFRAPSAVMAVPFQQGTIELYSLKIGGYILKPVTIPVKSGVPITSVVLNDSLASGVVSPSYILPDDVTLPAGLTLSNGVISGTPDELLSAETKIPLYVYYAVSAKPDMQRSTVGYLKFIPGETTGIAAVSAAKIEKSVSYYTLTGIATQATAKGLLLKKTAYTDGSVTVEKVMK